MKIEPTSFSSAGLRLAASAYLPDGGAPAGLPFVLACSGFQGLNDIHPARFARSLTALGYPCFGFDYRGFAGSEGARGRVRLEDQIEDIAAAAACVRARPDAAGRPLVLIGWGMAGGLILEAARRVGEVAGLVCLNGFYDAERVQRAVRGDEGWRAFLGWLEEKRLARARGAREAIDPFDIYPLDEVTRGYVDEVLRKNPRFGVDVTLEFADSLLGFRPERDLAHLAGTPVFIGHGSHNALHPPEEARALHRAYPGPKTLHWVEGGGHTEWMLDDHPKYLALMSAVAAWIGALG
jgi:uncharacterized protein